MTTSIYIPSLDNHVLFSLGKNSQDNFDIIDNADENDIWFHVQGSSSCHVIAHISTVGIENKKQIRQIIKQGSILCKSKSKCKSMKNTNIIYTEIKNVSKTNIIGTVIANNAKSLSI